MTGKIKLKNSQNQQQSDLLKITNQGEKAVGKDRIRMGTQLKMLKELDRMLCIKDSEMEMTKNRKNPSERRIVNEMKKKNLR